MTRPFVALMVSLSNQEGGRYAKAAIATPLLHHGVIPAKAGMTRGKGHARDRRQDFRGAEGHTIRMHKSCRQSNVTDA